MRAPIFVISLLAASVSFADNTAQFEEPGTVLASEFLPASLISGPNHTVSSEANSNGFQNTYTVNSKYGAFTTTGVAGVKKTVTEVDALTYLEAASRADVFVEALRDAGIETASAIAGAFTSPVKTVQGIPDGVGRVFEGAKRGFGITRRLLRGGKSDENGIDPKDFRELNYLLGNSEREWAEELKTDPYTTNMKLRETVSSMSVVEFVGGLPVDIALPMGAGLAVGVLGDETEIYKQSAEQLEKTNRACFAKLGVSADDIEAVINADYLTPTSQTAVCNALAKLEGVPGSTDLAASIASSESFEASDFLLQISNLLAWYQTDMEAEAPEITRIVVSDGLPYAMVGESAMLMLPAENLLWTEVLANRITAIEANKGSVWLLGTPTSTTAQALDARGWTLVTIATNTELHALYYKLD
jgi:hypothetical protein